MASTDDGAQILERDAERDRLGTLVDRVGAGEGGVLLVEGPAGIGKTALLRTARRLAGDREVRILSATASPLDREYPFGLVHQLFGPVLAGADTERLFAGAAGHAKTILSSADAAETPVHAVLHGLYWFCANLAETSPVLLVADDLHWADGPSLRFLEFLGRRLDGLGVALVAATRPNEPGADQTLLGALASGPVAHVLRPAPLSEEGVAHLLRQAIDNAPDPAFAAAAHQTTGGNPLLLDALLTAVTEQRLRGSAAEVDRVRTLGAGGVAAAVEQRLLPLGPGPLAFARAAAVLGERTRVSDLAALSELDVDAALAAADRLVGAAVMESGTWAFVHPLVRQAVLSRMSLADRERLHGLAADRVIDQGGRPEQAAVHLLQTQPSGHRRTFEVLQLAARKAIADGAVASAAGYLQRALDEPPPPNQRGAVLLELAELSVERGAPDAEDRIAAALQAGLEGDAAARARAARGRHAILRDPATAIDELEGALDTATDPDLRLRLEALLLEVLAYESGFVDRRAAVIAGGRADQQPSSVMLAHLTQDAAYRSAPRDEVAALARRALADGRLVGVVGPSATYHLLVMSLRHAGEADLADTALRAGEAAARSSGSRWAAYYLDHARAYWELNFGSVTAAEAHARSALGIAREAELPLGNMTLVALLGEVLIERGQLDEAEQHLLDLQITPQQEGVISGCDFLGARSELHRLRGRLEEAERDARRARELVQARGWTTPLKSLSGVRLAAVLIEANRPKAALAVLEEDAAAATQAQNDGVLGLVRRYQGRASNDVALLEQAVELLDGSAMRLDFAWALYDLGATLRRARKPSAAREPLRRALDEASRIGASRLAGLARDELLSAGARVRREALSGPASLTPSERRVAGLAADGLSNREIAEALWVTRKTIELHLGNAYAKLGVRSRAQLPEVLAA